MKIRNQLSIVIAGEAGQGIQSIENILTKIFKQAGFHIFATKEYMSRVRGGTNSIQIRVSESPVDAPVDRIDICIPLSRAAYEHVEDTLSPDSMVIGNGEALELPHIISVPFDEIAQKVGNRLYTNTVAAGVVSALMGIDQKLLNNYITERFAKRSEKIADGNLKAATEGYKAGEAIRQEGKMPFKIDLAPSDLSGHIMINGSQAVALGAIAGGVNSAFSYPMTPGTGAFTTLAGLAEKAKIAVEQAEDEIAAINMAIGNWYAGGRAFVSTSGGGFALMTEGISLSGITEVPVVVHIAQRPGPGTGLPTRTEQGDLNLALHAGHGYFPKAIYAPGTLEQAYELSAKAFHTADKFQSPVIILTDQYLVDAYGNVPRFKTDELPYADNIIVEADEDYKRYKLTESGISPRSVPGYGPGRVTADSDEHDETGRITEDLDGISMEMKHKRAKKIEALKKDALSPDLYGSKEANTLFLCWGSTVGPVKEAWEELDDDSAAVMHFSQVYPLPSNLGEQLQSFSKLVFVENNQEGSFANLVRLETGADSSHRIQKYNGLMFTTEELVKSMKEELDG
ncbi:2-oxoacid:acceptor oxidoreductase subunit alpha [Spirochaeta cellobiosiphila]|uniref:2-oxoacid:acceptor oxidoreductase subunit alpha n=1 Tax=Spirochaeta cellobiosiphila TaxID=504483 RepID=UPI0003FB87D9|nr:2-oxoacid:acceptor oxidoreductase subunit alpha [Spirochaeta cellobiosiphila]